MAERFGVEGRGAFYETTGCLRDVVENHLFQVVALLAMEPPAAMSSDAQRDEKAKVFRAMRALTSDDVVRGQYTGYRKEPGVARHPTSRPIARFGCSSTRRAGRACPGTSAPASAWPERSPRCWSQLKPPPQRLFADSPRSVGSSELPPLPAVAPVRPSPWRHG